MFHWPRPDCVQAFTHTNADVNRYSDTDAHTNTDGDANRHRDADSYGDPDCDGNQHANCDRDADRDGDPDQYTDGDTYICDWFRSGQGQRHCHDCEHAGSHHRAASWLRR